MKEEEHGIEPENRTTCPNTEGQHQWIWDEDQDDYFCDECGALESRQEEDYDYDE